MKLTNKGFAVTGIIYSMLVLFLALVLLIISSLASRKVLFDKEKGEILDRINQPPLCTAIAPFEQQIFFADPTTATTGMKSTMVGVQATSDAPYEPGAVYSCDLGDGARTFYVMETEGNNVKLIMSENLGGTTAWVSEENINNVLATRTIGWTKLRAVGGSAALPTGQEMAGITGYSQWTDAVVAPSSDYGPYWIRTGLAYMASPEGYWTTTRHSTIETIAWPVDLSGRLNFISSSPAGNINQDSEYGIRPIITVPKSSLSL